MANTNPSKPNQQFDPSNKVLSDFPSDLISLISRHPQTKAPVFNASTRLVDAVNFAKRLNELGDQGNWLKGAIAASLANRYGSSTLKNFAEQIQEPPRTVYVARQIYLKFADTDAYGLPNLTWAYYQEALRCPREPVNFLKECSQNKFTVAQAREACNALIRQAKASQSNGVLPAGTKTVTGAQYAAKLSADYRKVDRMLSEFAKENPAFSEDILQAKALLSQNVKGVFDLLRTRLIDKLELTGTVDLSAWAQQNLLELEFVLDLAKDIQSVRTNVRVQPDNVLVLTLPVK